MKKIALGLVALAGFASIAACKTSQQQTYQPRPATTTPTYTNPTYSGPTYTQPAPKPAPKAACGGGKCG